jgi:hypothetical protein
MTGLRPADICRFLARVQVEAALRLGMQSPCWTWRGATHVKGYGQFKVAGVVWYCHRFAWAVFRGGLPADKDIHHRCYNHACVNPDHLEPVEPDLHAVWSNHKRNGTGDGNGMPF